MNFNIVWNELSYSEFIKYLKSLADLKYCEFHKKIVNDNSIKYIGVRTPILRKIAKQISKKDYNSFVKINSHKFYEEILLHGFIITYADVDYDILIQMMKKFIPYMSNWALVDLFATKFKQFTNNMDKGFKEINLFINSDNCWEIRLGLVLLLKMYINSKYIDKILKISSSIQNQNYYVKMANAWLISECYIKFKDKTINFLQAKKLDFWTHNKAIQKIRESYKVNNTEKYFLNTLKIKK